MDPAGIVAPGERSARPRAKRLEISRRRAFLTHLGVSALIVGVACALIFVLWYPHPYFQAVGTWHILRILIGVDLVLGPLLTLIVFKPGKPGLKFDLCFIAFVQLLALGYGMTAIYQERPYFTVFALDRFVVLAHRDVDLAQLEDAKAAGRIGDKPLIGPLLAIAMFPADLAGQQRLLDETVFRGEPDIDHRPEFWRRYDDEAAQVIARARPLAVLRAARPESAAKIAALLGRLGLEEQRVGFVPMIAKNRDVSLVIDTASGAPLEVLDVDPWIPSPERATDAPPAAVNGPR